MTQLTGFRQDKLGAYIEKDPEATLDYTMDWSDWLASGDPLVDSTWTTSTITGDADPIVLGTVTTSPITGQSTVIVSGGTAGNAYTLTCQIETDNGLVDERYFRLFVKNRTL